MHEASEIRTPVADVYITSQLSARARKASNVLKEKAALQELAAMMADHPDLVLPRFVDLAMDLTGGISAGLSLYEENPAPGVFRWRYLKGTLSPFDGATTPRNFSPCGITLDENRPVLSSHPERVYNWISDANIVVPEVLLVPLYFGGTTPLGTLWIVSDEEGHFDQDDARAMTELAGFVGIALRMQRAEHKLQQALEEQKTLTGEMRHRVNNLFTVAQAMVHISARGAATKDEMVKNLSGRLNALAGAHALVRRNFSPEGSQHARSNLRELLAMVVRPHDGDTSRFNLSGPEVSCGEHAVNGVALVFHELATNALKYGALQAGDGQVDIGWSADDTTLTIDWRERGGPLIGEPAAKGFGTKLLHDTIVRQFGGKLDFDWRPEGLATRIVLPLDTLAK